MSTSTDRMRALRARRAAALAADPDAGRLSDADDLLGLAVEATIEALGLDGRDAAAAQLARAYSRAIDQARDPASAMRWLGPELLAVLAQLGGTAAARAKLVEADPAERRPPSALDELRAQRTRTFGRR